MAKKPDKVQFVRLDYDLIDSKAWIRLPKSAKVTFINFKRCRYKRNGQGKMTNTGEEIAFGFSDCPGIKSSATFVEAVESLRNSGFIELVHPGSFHPKRKATYKVSNKWRVLCL